MADFFVAVISEWSVFAIRNLRENHINNQRLVEMLRRQGTISKQMMKQMNKNVATSNYRFCVPGYKESPENGIPIELLDMSRSETKRYLRSYFTGGDPELLASISFSSDSSSSNDQKNQTKLHRKKRKAKKEYHKYSSSSSTSDSSCASDDFETVLVDDNPESKDLDCASGASVDSKPAGLNNCDDDSDGECPESFSNLNIGEASSQIPRNFRNESGVLQESLEKDVYHRWMIILYGRNLWAHFVLLTC